MDGRIAELSLTDKWLAPSAKAELQHEELRSRPATLIANLIEADAVSFFARKHATSNTYQLVAAAGAPAFLSLSKEELLKATPLPKGAEDAQSGVSSEFSCDGTGAKDLNDLRRTLIIRLGKFDEPSGALVITHRFSHEPDNDLLRLCAELAASYVGRLEINELGADAERVLLPSHDGWRLPRGVEWKARALAILQRRMMARARFIDRALRSIDDGLVVADIDGLILFANPRAVEIFAVTESALIGSDLFQRIAEGDGSGAQTDKGMTNCVIRETLVRLVVERRPVEREIALGDAPTRYYMLRVSAVADEERGTLLGIVASLSDVTKQRELQQTKNDVMMLVTHELRTPLTAIQGMSEVLSQYDLDQKRRREMHLAINEEAMRLARMINDYLNITRLESGVRPLRLAPTRIAPLVERALLLLDPLAEQREMRIVRKFAPNLPPLLVDADLLAQAVTNLVANAIKYSHPCSEMIVELRTDRDTFCIEVTDHGQGLPAESLSRIFEKFYRVPRLADADVSGTGLGLAFVREIAEKHGGRITVESEEGVGSVFSLRLPLS